MKHLILPMLFALSTAAFAASKQDYGNVVVSEVRSIYDGDTFKVSIDSWPAIIGESIGVRVAGVDTPEMRGECDWEKELARKAKKHTVAFLRAGKRIEPRSLKRDKYFRILAEVYVDRKSLSLSLITAGLGREYHGGKRKSWCKMGL
jgi:micrococcal nuclease